MSDETLSRLVAHAIAANLSPLLKWLYAVFAGITIGTAAVVGMVYDVRGGIEDAKRDAQEAKKHAIETRAAADDLMKLVLSHDRSIGILEDRRKGGGE